MELHEFFKSVGGVATVRMGGDPKDPSDLCWNFGLVPKQPGVVIEAQQSFHQMFPNLQGRWDGQTTICHHEAVRKVLGADIKPHQQPKGTCGGRSGSRGAEILQCVLIANGKRAKFKYVSHAWLYYLARREYNMLRGGDGVADGSIPPVMAKYGALHRDESGDSEMAGPSSDNLAAAWGGGRLSAADAQRFEQLAKDNIVKISVPVKTPEEMADALASGAVISCSDSRGYSMTRDSNGFCRASGTWYHYHVRSGVRVVNGRKGFEYNQSWGPNTPSGPVVPGCPDNVFLVDWDTEAANMRNGTFHALLGMDLWELESGNLDLRWIFL
jgi:hypothetical protein